MDITLKSPVPFDIRRTYYWLKNPNLRYKFLMDKEPELSIHINYWRKLLNEKFSYVYSIYFKKKHVGNAGIKNINKKYSEAEIWLYIGEQHNHGKGIGEKTLRYLEYKLYNLRISNVILHLDQKNIPAFNLYKKMGYKIKNKTNFNYTNNNVIRMVKNL